MAQTTSKRRVVMRVVTWTTVGAIGLTVAAVAANASTSAASKPSARAGAGVGAGRALEARALRGVIHADFVRKVGATFVTQSLQRGMVTAVSPTSITVVSPDNFTRTYVINSATKIHLGRANSGKAITDLPSNARAVVLATQSGNTWTANQIVAGLKAATPTQVSPSPSAGV